MDRSKTAEFRADTGNLPGGRLTSVADFSADLLNGIFGRLGPAPQDLVPVSACLQDSLSHSLEYLAERTWEHGCRGIVKDFPASRMYSKVMSEGAKRLEQSGGYKCWPCPYCSSATFPLHQGLFFENWDALNQDWCTSCPEGFEWFSEGHIMLACIGALGKRNGPCIACSGEGLTIEPCGLVFFLAKHGGAEIKGVKEALRFKALLSTGDLSEMKRRLESLAYNWPSEMWDRPKAGFAGVLEFLSNRRAFQGLMSPGMKDRLMSYVQFGSPGLDECMQAVTKEALSVFPAPAN
ncbi:hypothetical protein KFL_000590130 [Klebsormidium nitens]|uniref:Uncharacterized protein n=1 Tax=Klebsormidium nitens TaxID=105231 RepID=A0A1Y1HPW0_KLENI|nr:hypothetical protein KFL_000590130 [Klebsormidium nitens]|eukprot:GAQ80660.1 hypothetical protein KFL_000590130 [Klebsormidium nitens]